MSRYAKWRMGATPQECRSYNTTDRILLTFDDFGDVKQITALLKILKDRRVKAVFFLVGEWATAHPELVTHIAEAGHWIGNHTYSHQNMTKLLAADLTKEITGGPKASLLRPPYGIYNSQVREAAAALGYRIAYWTIDSKDWTGLPANRILDRVIPELHPGACVLMHINAPHTLEALPSMITQIRAKGYELCHDGTELAV